MSFESSSSPASSGSQGPAGTPGALIVGGAHGALAMARSLGRRGIPVWFVTDNHPIAKFSRYVKHSFSWAGPDHDGAAALLLDMASRHGLDGWVLMAGGDEELRFLSQHRDELSSVFRVTVPPWNVARWAYDKRLTYQ